MKINRFRLLLLVGTLVLAMFLVSGVYANPATEELDSVNIGDTASEAGHNLSGWSDIQDGCGWCSPDETMRLIWGAGDTCELLDNSASFTLDAGTGVATSLKMQHLDGVADDGFNVYVNGDHVGNYVATPETANVWYSSEFDLTGSEYTGELTVDIQATGIAWGGCKQFGQVGFSQVELLGEPDSDGDGVIDEDDNCPDTPNADQADLDEDGTGDVCDEDIDGDDVPNDDDNCRSTPNSDQADADVDGVGDVCDPDRDGDGVLNDVDNCPDAANPDQRDSDKDGVGDACEEACGVKWMPPISLTHKTVNVNASLPIKFRLLDCDDNPIRGDVDPKLFVGDSADSEQLHIGTGGSLYVAIYRPKAVGEYTAAVYLPGEDLPLDTKNFTVVEAGEENGKASEKAEAKEERKENKVTGKPTGDDGEPKKNEKPPGKPSENDNPKPDGNENDNGNGKAKGKDKDKGNGKGN